METKSQKYGVNAFKEVRKLLNERRSNLLRKETNEIRKKIYKKEFIYNLKKKQQEGSLTNREERMLKNIDKYLKNLKNFLEKLQKY